MSKYFNGLRTYTRAAYRTWGQRGQNENFQNLGEGNGMRVSKQFSGFPKVWGKKLIIEGANAPCPPLQPCICIIRTYGQLYVHTLCTCTLTYVAYLCPVSNNGRDDITAFQKEGCHLLEKSCHHLKHILDIILGLSFA